MTDSDRDVPCAPEHGESWLARQSLPGQTLICGSAPTLLEEFDSIRARMPEALVIAVNESARVIHADFLMTQHPEKAERFRKLSMNSGVIVHTGKPRERAMQPGIHVYWPGCVTLATSGGSAIKIAMKMGFSQIVLCGLPMNGGDGYFSRSSLEQDEPRFGLEDPDSDYIRGYQKKLIEFTEKEPEALKRVRSLSGFTRKLFGPPTWS